MRTFQRERAARNLLIAAVNTALERGIIALEARAELPQGGVTYAFDILGRPVIAHVAGIGWEEISIHVTLDPTEQGRRLIGAWPPHRSDGAATAHGWLERKQGKWLQPVGVFRCTNAAKSELAAMRIAPQGYAEHGKLMM